MSGRVKVLIVDDSALVRKAISTILSLEKDIEVIGLANDPYQARDLIKAQAPDVIILDLEMPRMDGLTFLKLIMERRPCPVIIFSTLSTSRSQYAMEAFRCGAFDVLGKPTSAADLKEQAPHLVRMVRAAGGSRISTLNGAANTRPESPVPAIAESPSIVDNRRMILIGASTGGTEAVCQVLAALPPNLPPVCVVQHIPEFFCAAFVDRLNAASRLDVRMATHGEQIGPGQVRVAPGDRHLKIRFNGSDRSLCLDNGPKVHFQRPAVDVLFNSIPEDQCGKVVAVILTGMGKDGAEGMLRIRNHGGQTIAQDESTSVVYGMPREAARIGAARHIKPLHEIAAGIVQLSSRKSQPTTATAIHNS